MMVSSSPSSSPSPPPSSPKKIQNFFFQEMKSTCRDQARKSKFFFVFLHFCNFQQKKLKTLQIQKSHCSCPNQWPHPHSEHFMCILNRWALQGPLDFYRYSLQRMLTNFFYNFWLYLYLYLYLYLTKTKTKTKTKTMSKRHTLGISKWLPSTKDNITFKIRGRIHIRSKWCVFCNRWTAWF